jgi:hypothetical protein
MFHSCTFFYLLALLDRSFAFKVEVALQVQEAAESCGATCVEIWSKKNNATHVVCESRALPKYIALNLHLVSPMWVMSVQGGSPLRCVQYSADLARNIADLVLSGKSKSRHSHVRPRFICPHSFLTPFCYSKCKSSQCVTAHLPKWL